MSIKNVKQVFTTNVAQILLRTFAVVSVLTLLQFSGGCGKIWFTVPYLVKSATVVALYPANGANWNDYVTWTNKGGAGTVYNQPDLPCAGTELGYYSCIHGGEKRAVVIPAQNSCANISTSDALGAFDWSCAMINNSVTVYTRGLKFGMGLRNLVSASSFKLNQVSVFKNGSLVAQSQPAIWWSNPVIPLPSNPNNTDNPVGLSISGAIYTLSASTATSGYDVYNTNKVALVTLGSTVLNYSGFATLWCDGNSGNINLGGGTYRTILCTGASTFLWVEANLSGTTSGSTVFFDFLLKSNTFSRVRNSQLTSTTAAGANSLITNSVASSLFEYSSFSENAQGSGLIMYGSTYNIVANSSAYDNLTVGNGTGFVVTNASNFNTFYQDQAFGNTLYGFEIANTGVAISSNNLVNLTGAGNSSDGLAFYDSSSSTSVTKMNILNYTGIQNSRDGLDVTYSAGGTFVNVAAINNATYGIGVLSSSNTEVFNDVVAAYNPTGIYVSTANDTQFLNTVWVKSNSTIDCNGNGATYISSAGPCLYGVGLATTAVTSYDPAASLIGILGAPDSANPVSQGVTGTAAYATMTDWIDFSSPFRFWAVSGVTGQYTAVAQRGPCTVGTCQIEDSRIKISDTFLRNQYGSLVNGQGCPSSLNPNVAANVMTDQQAPSHTFLIHATEVMDPSLNPTGNYNGLCESGEACIFSPNIGGYQGEGDFTQQNCIFTAGNGFVGNVIYGYPYNGN